MKKFLLTFFIPLFLFKISFTQNGTSEPKNPEKGRILPSVNINTLEGSTFNTGKISNNGKPIIISFWATWCSPCKKELNTLAEVYDDWKEKTGVKLIAISIDDSRNMGKVAPYVNGQGWDFEVYIDPNSNFKRALNVINVPHTFLLNGQKEIVWEHNSYSPGDEDILFGLIQKMANSENHSPKETPVEGKN